MLRWSAPTRNMRRPGVLVGRVREKTSLATPFLRWRWSWASRSRPQPRAGETKPLLPHRPLGPLVWLLQQQQRPLQQQTRVQRLSRPYLQPSIYLQRHPWQCLWRRLLPLCQRQRPCLSWWRHMLPHQQHPRLPKPAPAVATLPIGRPNWQQHRCWCPLLLHCLCGRMLRRCLGATLALQAHRLGVSCIHRLPPVPVASANRLSSWLSHQKNRGQRLLCHWAIKCLPAC